MWPFKKSRIEDKGSDFHADNSILEEKEARRKLSGIRSELIRAVRSSDAPDREVSISPDGGCIEVSSSPPDLCRWMISLKAEKPLYPSGRAPLPSHVDRKEIERVVDFQVTAEDLLGCLVWNVVYSLSKEPLEIPGTLHMHTLPMLMSELQPFLPSCDSVGTSAEPGGEEERAPEYERFRSRSTGMYSRSSLGPVNFDIALDIERAFLEKARLEKARADAEEAAKRAAEKLAQEKEAVERQRAEGAARKQREREAAARQLEQEKRADEEKRQEACNLLASIFEQYGFTVREAKQAKSKRSISFEVDDEKRRSHTVSISSLACEISENRWRGPALAMAYAYAMNQDDREELGRALTAQGFAEVNLKQTSERTLMCAASMDQDKFFLKITSETPDGTEGQEAEEAASVDVGNAACEPTRGREEIDCAEMNGYEFERFCAALLKKSGYAKVVVTRGSGDQGIDIVATRDGVKYGIQCKRYSSDVGNRAVQEAYAGKAFYGCHVAVIMTNSRFTPSAKDLAAKNGVVLWDGGKLQEMSEAARHDSQSGNRQS